MNLSIRMSTSESLRWGRIAASYGWRSKSGFARMILDAFALAASEHGHELAIPPQFRLHGEPKPSPRKRK